MARWEAQYTMPCPKCGGTDFDSKAYQGVGVHRCGGCHGLLVASESLDDLIAAYLARHPDLPPRRLELARSLPQPDGKPRSCPACGARLRAVNYAYDSNVYIDRCEGCSRVWLDPEELVALARHWKGHPKLNRLGDSVAEAMLEREQFQETLANLPSLPWLLALSPLPIGDNLNASRLPVVNLLLMVICVVVPVVAWWIGVPMERVWHVFGLVPARIVAGEAWLTTVTSMFVHGGFVHLLGNMFALAVFGDNVECRLGSVRYLIFYLVCGVAGSLAHTAYYPAETVPAIGASGAIAGVLGAYVVFYPQATIRTIYGINAPAFAYIGVWIASQLFAILLIVKYGHGAAIGYFAHLGGLATGLLVAISMRVWDSRRARRGYSVA